MKAAIGIIIKDEDIPDIGAQKTEEMKTRAKNIMAQIKSMSELNYSSILYTNGTNTMIIDTVMSPQEIEYHSEQIKKIPFVQHIIYYSNYVTELEEAKKSHDYFKVFAYSSTILEYYGKQLLLKKLSNKFSRKDLARLNLSFIEILLYANGLIEEGLYKDLKCISNNRNKFIHKSIKQTSISHDDIKQMENLATKCIDSVSNLIMLCDEK